jgi:twitching motility protein PilT
VQRGSYAAVFRRIPFKLPSIGELNLPEVLESFVHLPKGLVLITGPTGSGKSTSLAGIMRSIIEKRAIHIVTIEDPIEFLFADGKAAVSQREVPTDSPSFNEALKNMFRQDPDVIMVGEMRDWNTMQTAITAAETGHLVFSTLHTNSAAQSIDRIIDSCPVEQQAQVRSQLSIVLQAIVSMNLIETSEGSGRVPVVEVMVNAPKIAKHILAGEVKEIHEEIENSVNYYKMQSMNQSLIALLVNRRITYAKAMELSTDPEDLSLKLRKLFPQIEENHRGGLMASDSDFSQITQLLEIKRLYEEQEEKWKLRLSEKDEEVSKHVMELRDQRRVIEGRDQVLTDMETENTRLKADAERVNREVQQKTTQLNDRIKELNQRLMMAEGGGRAAAGGGAAGGGFFKK